MDAEKIVENMKAVLKRTKRRKSQNKKHSEKNTVNEASNNNEDDMIISELMTKNWQMKTPPVTRKEINGQQDCDSKVAKQKVNAFEKMMSRRSNNDTSSQNVATSPDISTEGYKEKSKRRTTKKSISLQDDGQFSLISNAILVNDSPNSSTKKRNRTNDACSENSSKKRKTKDCKLQLDSNGNSPDNNENNFHENHQTERPKRSCVNKIDYSQFSQSPDKNSPEKKSAHQLDSKIGKLLESNEKLAVNEHKENGKLAPLFAKKAKNIKNETPILRAEIKEEIVLTETEEKHQSGRPRRSCVNKTDYSLLLSPENNSPEKRPLRSKSETDNIVKNLDIEMTSPENPTKSNGKLAPVFGLKTSISNKKNQEKTNKPIIIEHSIESSMKTPEKIDIPQQETPQSGRPKRSCTNRIDYSQLFGSPEKKSPEKKSSNNTKAKTEKFPNVICIDETTPVKKTKPDIKLAPLFVKRIPKPAVDPAILEARRNFLLSELPANLRAPIEKQRQYEEEILSNEMVAFPKVSHITQLENINEFSNDKENKFKIRIEDDDDDDDVIPENMIIKCGLLTDCTNADYNVTAKNHDLNKEKLESITDIKEAVRNIKENSGNFPVNRCFKQILSKLKSAKEMDESDENGTSFLNSTFADIFKPSNFEETLIGLEPVKSLQEFLNTWNDNKNGKFDYESDDSSSRQSLRAMNNCAVLSGKSGSGKTSSVYALANDLNYEVIEINAGSRRSGKKILQELLEATQSHRVENGSNLMDEESSSDHFVTNVADKKTIILIEDAELTFENDDGFVSSIQQLINISKRPVILTTNDSNCQHLQKFIQHNEIIYDTPKSYVTKYLSLISVATSNYHIDEAEIENLYTFNGYDLRKTINEIEFFIRSESASVNGGSLMGLFCDTENKNRLQKGSQLAFHSQRDLSTLRSRSSIISDYSALLSCSQRVFESGEISYHQYNLMNEMANFFDQSNLPKNEYQKKRQQIISR